MEGKCWDEPWMAADQAMLFLMELAMEETTSQTLTPLSNREPPAQSASPFASELTPWMKPQPGSSSAMAVAVDGPLVMSQTLVASC